LDELDGRETGRATPAAPAGCVHSTTAASSQQPAASSPAEQAVSSVALACASAVPIPLHGTDARSSCCGLHIDNDRWLSLLRAATATATAASGGSAAQQRREGVRIWRAGGALGVVAGGPRVAVCQDAAAAGGSHARPCGRRPCGHSAGVTSLQPATELAPSAGCQCAAGGPRRGARGGGARGRP
jgi:hypothetical protein